jgi:uncharacterized membrane protein
MPRFHKPDPDVYDPEPRWPAFIAALAVAGLYAALPPQLIFGPRWLVPLLVIILVIPTEITHARNLHSMNRLLGFVVSGVITMAMIVSIVLLVEALPERKETPTQLLVSAACLWATNILVFTLWYWRLDAGGPHLRDKRPAHTDGAFLFPQMTMSEDAKTAAGEDKWSPNFFDYLFLAFNTSTAFSPTDVPVLARWAKLLIMVQSITSLTVLALLAARAVNIL